MICCLDATGEQEKCCGFKTRDRDPAGSPCPRCPSRALLKLDITRVLTPGTVLEEGMLSAPPQQLAGSSSGGAGQEGT